MPIALMTEYNILIELLDQTFLLNRPNHSDLKLKLEL